MADASKTQRGGRLASLLWFPWSIVTWVGALTMLAIMVLVLVPVVLVVPFHRFQTKYPQPQVSWPLWLAFSRLRRHWDENYDPKAVTVFVQNHVSMFDGFIATGCMAQPICGLENAAHLHVPGYGWMMRMANAIPVHPRRRNFNEIAAAFRERASRGISVLAFPEGHRTLDGKMRPFKRGVFVAARDAGLPITPIAVRGARRLLPKGAFTIRPTVIDAWVGPQVPTEGLRDADLMALMELLREVMSQYVDSGVQDGERLLAFVRECEAKNSASAAAPQVPAEAEA